MLDPRTIRTQVGDRSARDILERIVEAEPVLDVVEIGRPRRVAVAQRGERATYVGVATWLAPFIEIGDHRLAAFDLEYPTADSTSARFVIWGQSEHQPTIGYCGKIGGPRRIRIVRVRDLDAARQGIRQRPV